MQRQRRRVGDLLLVPLGDGSHTYARVLEEPLMAFYDARADCDLEPTEVVSRPILFKVWVMNRAITSGRWRRLVTLPLDAALEEPPTFFKQNALDHRSFSLYRDGRELPATRSQCEGLERAAIWDPEHVEDRLRDHYLGQPNTWLESLRP